MSVVVVIATDIISINVTVQVVKYECVAFSFSLSRRKQLARDSAFMKADTLSFFRFRTQWPSAFLLDFCCGFMFFRPFCKRRQQILRNHKRLWRTHIQTVMRTPLLGGARCLLSGRQCKRAPPPLSPEPSVDSSLLGVLAVILVRCYPLQRSYEVLFSLSMIRFMSFSARSLDPISAGFSRPGVLTSCSTLRRR